MLRKLVVEVGHHMGDVAVALPDNATLFAGKHYIAGTEVVD